jgi:hypothetical protein
MYDRSQGERLATALICQTGVARRPVVTRATGRAASAVLVFAACLLLASALMLFFQVRSFLGHIETKLVSESGGDPRLRAIGLQMEALRGKFHGLLAESVEVRLKSLEKNVEAGKITADDLRAFEELQKDLKLLESYAGAGGTTALDYSEREHSRFRAIPEAGPVRNEQLLSEMVEVKTLFYLCLAGIATGTLMMMGYYWMRHRGEARYIHGLAEQMSMLTHQPSDLGG